MLFTHLARKGAFRSPFTIFEEYRRRLGNSQINLAFRSPFTIFAVGSWKYRRLLFYHDIFHIKIKEQNETFDDAERSALPNVMFFDFLYTCTAPTAVPAFHHSIRFQWLTLTGSNSIHTCIDGHWVKFRVDVDHWRQHWPIPHYPLTIDVDVDVDVDVNPTSLTVNHWRLTVNSSP